MTAERRARRLTLVLAAALLAGAGISTWQAVVATEAKHDALTAAAAESTAKDAAAAKEAETRTVLNFVQARIFAAARPKGHPFGLGRDVSLRKAVEAALPAVAQSFANQPLTEARLRLTLGASFDSLGDPKTAGEQFQRAYAIHTEHLGPDHPDTLRSLSEVAISYSELGRYADAAKLQKEVLARRKAALGPDHLDTLRSMTNLASCYFALGRYDDALALRETTLSRQRALLGPDHHDTLSSMNNLATSYAAAHRYADAIQLFNETLVRRKAVLGPKHFETLQSMNNLAMAFAEAGRRAEALALREETLARQKSALGADHPNTLRTMNNVANSYFDLGRYADSLKLYDETLALQKVKLGTNHPDTLNSMWGVAANLIKLDRHAEALPILDDCLHRAVGRTVHRSIAAVAALRLRHFQKAMDANGCRTTAELWEQLRRTDASSLYTAACLRAVTAAVDGRSPAAEADADRAMDWLQRAVAAGYRDAEQLQHDPDLAAVRGRADFADLLWNLADQPLPQKS